MLVITHTHEAGTLIDGTSKGDGTAGILKHCGWRWGRSISAWYVPHSRDRLPKLHIITRTQKELNGAGYIVSVDVDTTARSTAEVEAGKSARIIDRVSALETKAERKRSEECQAWQAADAAHNRLPEGGEPIKVGHHSEGKHRRAIEKAHNSLSKAVDARKTAQYVEERLSAAQKATERRYSVGQVARRIEKLEAELRGTRRILNGYTRAKGTPYEEWMPAVGGTSRDYHLAIKAETTDKLSYWKDVRAGQIATGQATNYGKDTVSKGDYVKVRGQWRKVARANAKTVSVETGYSWTDKVPYHEVQDHQQP